MGKSRESWTFNRLCILYDARRFQTLVDTRYRRNVHMSCDFCIRTGLVCWYQFQKAQCQNFACLDCKIVIKQRSGKCRQRVQRVQRISSVQLIIFSGFYSGTEIQPISSGITEVSSVRNSQDFKREEAGVKFKTRFWSWFKVWLSIIYLFI